MDSDAIKIWLANPITRKYQRLMIEEFDFQRHLLFADSGTTLDKFKGRAEVLKYVIDPPSLFEKTGD